MATTHTWHPGTSRVDGRWPVPVPMAPDEIFSMWLVRASLAQGCDPMVVAGYLWPMWRPWTTDLDRGISDARLSPLVRLSGIDANAFRAACLRPIALATGANLSGAGSIWPWILPLGSRNRKRNGGLQYCSVCLASDARPFFRLQWRLAWHTCCAVHQIGLKDRCCHCHAPVEPHRLLSTGVMTSCATCGGDLRSQVQSEAVKGAQVFQDSVDNVVVSAFGHYGSHKLNAKEWFFLGKYLLMLLRCASRNKAGGLATCLRMLDPDTELLARPITGLGFEMLPPGERAAFLSSVGKLVLAGPERLGDAAASVFLKGESLRQGWPLLPSQISAIVRTLPQESRSRRSNLKPRVSQPIAPQSVAYKWARLNRRMRQIS
jgi:hypothetical protein